MITRPVRLQLSRRKGFNLQAHSRAVNGLPAVNVARPSKWGNPFRAGAIDPDEGLVADASMAVRLFHGMICDGDLVEAHIADALRGKNLACWCKPGDPCHADILLKIANR